MPETLQGMIAQIKLYISQLSPSRRLLLAGIALLIVVTAGTSIVLFKRDPYQTLYVDLRADDSRSVAKKLSELKIPYRITEDNSAVLVPSSQVHPARMQLAKEGIPGQEVVGFEKFDASTLGMSSYVQKINYRRAIEGELTRSIQSLAAVRRARVHISMPPKKTFMEDEEAPKASVMLELKPGQIPSKSEMRGIAHLVSSAVEGLKVNQVTIVDTHGNFLHQPEDSASPVPNALFELQRSIEIENEKRILEILTPVVGLGKVKAKVTAEMDLSRMNTTEETYDPEKAVPRNTVKNDEVTQGSRPNPIGIPGSRSNLPGTETQNPPIPMANTTSEKNVQNTYYAIPKKVQTIDKPSGNIKRLSVAVVVDGTYSKAAGVASESFAPRSEEELERIKDVVGNAVGIDANRGDSITVRSMPFKTEDLTPAEKTATVFNWQEFLVHALRNGLVGLVILLFFFLVVRPFLRWATLSELKQEVELLPKTVAELEAARKDEGLLALTRAASVLEEGEPIEKKEGVELTKRLGERLDESPRKALRIMQDWLDEDLALPQPKELKA
ncbi:MAG: flagellar M-ring protein FliF [Deltaproteobacteria bacterium]|nr:flagellar M-ring protein FliF [Deltaproteobacteria bacterium]